MFSELTTWCQVTNRCALPRARLFSWYSVLLDEIDSKPGPILHSRKQETLSDVRGFFPLFQVGKRRGCEWMLLTAQLSAPAVFC